MSNHTHRQQLARTLATRCNISYQKALEHVTRAAKAGLLPATLGPNGINTAVDKFNDEGQRDRIGSSDKRASLSQPVALVDRVCGISSGHGTMRSESEGF